MLSQAENERLCRVGPGTPMGETLRRYWVPVCESSDLPVPDSDPYRVQALGERFVAFRDSLGRPGLLDEACMHRGTSLALGRVEDCGIRCLFHGWKYGVDGEVQETPNLQGATFRSKMRAPAYPVREAGGLVWAYFGPPGEEPAFPRYDFMDADPDRYTIVNIRMDCNWVQLLEGGLDSSHLGILHADYKPLDLRPADTEAGAEGDPVPVGIRGFRTEVAFDDNAPSFEIENTDFGFQYAAIRRATSGEESATYVRVASFVLPYLAIIAGVSIFYVPRDDEHTNWIIVVPATDPQAPVSRADVLAAYGLDHPGAWVDGHLRCDEHVRWGQDRSRMDSSFSGITGLVREDAAVSASMGAIADRTREHLAPSDVAVIRARKLLLNATRDVEAGARPVGHSPADHGRIGSGEGLVPEGGSWHRLLTSQTSG